MVYVSSEVLVPGWAVSVSLRQRLLFVRVCGAVVGRCAVVECCPLGDVIAVKREKRWWMRVMQNVQGEVDGV